MKYAKITQEKRKKSPWLATHFCRKINFFGDLFYYVANIY